MVFAEAQTRIGVQLNLYKKSKTCPMIDDRRSDDSNRGAARKAEDAKGKARQPPKATTKPKATRGTGNAEDAKSQTRKQKKIKNETTDKMARCF